MFNDISKKSPDQHHETVASMSRSGQHMSVIEYLENLMKHVDHLNFDDRLPSLYSYLGVAYHDASNTEKAIASFQNCTLYHLNNPDPR
jgi:DNA gyrase inhibitor GyrI